MNFSKLVKEETEATALHTETVRKTDSLGFTKPRVYVPVIGLVFLVLLPLAVKQSYYLNILNLMLLFASVGIAWNVLGGYARQVSLGHGIFFGIGAYTSTLLQIYWNITPWVGMIVGGILAVVVGFIIGLGVFRLRGHYFAISTIAYSTIVMLLFVKFYTITGGAQGLSVPMRNSFWMMQFDGKLPYYYVFLAVMLIMVLVARLIEKSRLGYYMIAMGQDEQAARAIGINIPKVKHTSFAISAFCTAVIGTLYVQYMYFVEPAGIFSVQMSVEFALVSIVGGLGTVFGPVLGAFIMKPIVTLTNDYFGNVLPGLNYTIYGVILILVIVLLPNGLIGPFSNGYRYLLSKLPGYRTDGKGGTKI